MATFALDENYTATCTPYRRGDGYVAKGTIFHKSKLVEVFEAHGGTPSSAEEAARAKAEEIWRRLKAAKVAKGRAAKKRSPT
jgi:hypothetical protein